MRCSSLVAVIALLAAASCVTAEKKPPPPPLPPQATSPTTAGMEAGILADTKKTAAEQMECPIDDLIARCTTLDAQGGCVAIEVRGCDKVLQYNFGVE